MSKSSTASKTIPDIAANSLVSLGANLRTARERRGESLRSWALRMDVSVPTLQRMENGDASVGVGVYATAIWLCGLSASLAEVASPSSDADVHEIEIRRASRRRK